MAASTVKGPQTSTEAQPGRALTQGHVRRKFKFHSLIDKVRVGLPPTENAERYRQGATVTIALRDGRSFTSTVYAPKGSGQLGIAWNDIDSKFRALAPLGGLGGDAISRTLDIIHDFRRAAGVSPLLDLLRPAN